MHIVKGSHKNTQLNRVKGLWFKAIKELQLGKWLKALHYLNQCIEIKEDYIPALQNLAEIYFQRENPSEAEDYIKKALHYGPRDGRSHFIMGRILLNKDIKGALDHFEKAREYGGLTWGVAHNLALCYMHVNQNEKALEFIQKARELDPINIKSCLLMADFYRGQKKLKEARDILLEAKHMRPHDLSIDYLLGLIYLAMDKHKDCLIHWERFYKANSQDISFIKKLIQIYYQVGQISKAIQVLEKTLEFDPDNKEIKMILEIVKQERK